MLLSVLRFWSLGWHEAHTQRSVPITSIFGGLQLFVSSSPCSSVCCVGIGTHISCFVCACACVHMYPNTPKQKYAIYRLDTTLSVFTPHFSWDTCLERWHFVCQRQVVFRSTTTPLLKFTIFHRSMPPKGSPSKSRASIASKPQGRPWTAQRT